MAPFRNIHNHPSRTVEVCRNRFYRHHGRVSTSISQVLIVTSPSNPIISATISLALCIIMHPALLTRVILIAIFTPLALLFALLPLPRTQRIALRTLASASGAFGTILATALLTQIPAWANVWERLWTANSLQWGTAQERGLDAAFCTLWAAGAACDWVLKKQFGEDPDQVRRCLLPFLTSLHMC